MTTQSTWLAVVIAAIGMVGTVAAGAIGYKSGSEAVNKDYVSLAISTLDKKDVNPDLRKWSVDVLNKLSPVPFDKKLREELATSGIYGGRAVLQQIDVPTEIRRRCPDILKLETRESALTQDEVNTLIRGYEVCRIRHDSFVDLIDGYNEITDRENAKIR